MELGPAGYAAAFAATFAVATAVMPGLRKFALRNDVVDAPDGQRKLQTAPIPYLGGVGIALSVAAVVSVAVLASDTVGEDLVPLLGLLGPAIVLATVGLIDDIRGLGTVTRFVAQSGAGALTAFLMASSGTRGALSGVFWLDAAITMLWVIGVTNALNLLDNMDGLAGGTAGIAGLAFFAVAAANGQYLVAALALSVAGACGGFLIWNRFPARIYMGDSGSLFLGFMLAAIGVRIDLAAAPQPNALVVPVLILAIPILDTSLVVISRLRRGVSPFLGGLDHLSHRLRRTGHTVPGTVALILTAATGAGLLALLISRVNFTYGAVLALAAAVAFTSALVYALRLPESDAIRS